MEDKIFYKYLEIKQDIINNLKDVFLRQNYYTKKYRGTLLTDINVAIDVTPERDNLVQIFVRYKGKWIKDVLVFNRKGIVSSDITSNLIVDVDG